MKRIGINGLGRIGRLVLRHYLSNKPDNIEIVAANDLTPIDDIAYLLRFDSVHRGFPLPIAVDHNHLRFGSGKLIILNERDPSNLPWKELGVNIVLECTGLFRKREAASKHLHAGASKVIISAPSEDCDLTIVIGVNQDSYDTQKHHIISNASCTTNSLAPVAKLLNDTFGVEYMMVTTIHAYTASQALIDQSARKRRRGRAAAVSLIPTSTGAANATTLVIPELKSKMDAIAIRAPIPDGAITDIVAHLNAEASVEEVNDALNKSSREKLRGILEYSEDELVSADIIGNAHSGIVDGPSTRVIMNKVVKVLIWYDNEYGYAARLVDLASYIAK
jgi:glyceraldehyde-3-phosphate dehydrogenase type I